MFNIAHTICPSCSVGCGINIISDGAEIKGTYPYKRHNVNEGKNCLNGRNSINLAKNKIDTKTDTPTIINEIKTKINQINNEEIGIILYGTNTNEEINTLKEVTNKLNIENIGVITNNIPKIENTANYNDIETAQNIIIIGNIIYENPLVGRRIVIAKANGANIKTFDTEDKTITGNNSDEYTKINSISEAINKIGDIDENTIIILNKLDSFEDYDNLKEIIDKTNAKLLPVYPQSNTKGTLNEFKPLTNDEAINIMQSSKLLFLIGNNTFDNLNEAENINSELTVSISNVNTPSTENSDLIIPGKTWLEKEGSFTNSEGTTQKFNMIVDNPQDTNVTESEFFNQLLNEL